MSLLLDALRRAEEAKRAKQGPGSNGELPLGSDPTLPQGHADPSSAPGLDVDLSLEPETPPREVTAKPSAGMSRAPSPPGQSATALGGASALDFSLAELETGSPTPTPAPTRQVAATAESPLAAKPSAGTPAIDERTQRDQIKNAFSAKARNAGSQRRKWLPAVLAVVIVLIGGGGWYVWNEIQRVSRPALAQAVRPAPVPAPALPPAAPSTGAVAGSAPAKTPALDEPRPAPSLPPLLPPEPPKVAEAQVAAVAAVRPLTAAERIAKSIKAAGPKSAPAVALKPSSSPEARIHPGLTQAYAALQAGDLKAATAEYERVVAAEPLNLDAHLGLAAAAAKSGDRARAMRHYQQALDIDPKNAYAMGGVVALRNESGPDRQEAGLRAMIAQNPDASALHFALGNLLAAQRRWQEAQQAYFDAWRGEPERADFAYNLAISLDQLKQAKLAREYYGKALALARSGGAQFDPAAVSRRMGELAATSP